MRWLLGARLFLTRVFLPRALRGSETVAPRPTRWQKLAGSDELRHMWEGSSEKQVSLVGSDEIMHQWEGGAR